MSRSGVRFPAAPPPAFQQTEVHDGSPQKRPSSGVFGRYTAGNRGRETVEFEISVPYPPTVSAGEFSDPSFCRCRDRVRAGLSPESEQSTLILP